jgi:hypothetical protein
MWQLLAVARFFQLSHSEALKPKIFDMFVGEVVSAFASKI